MSNKKKEEKRKNKKRKEKRKDEKKGKRKGKGRRRRIGTSSGLQRMKKKSLGGKKQTA